MRRKVPVVDALPVETPWWEEDISSAFSGVQVSHAVALASFLTVLLASRIHARARSSRVRKLDLAAMDNVLLFKEVMMAYLNAAILEPLLSLCSSELQTKDLLMNLCELLGLFWWTHLITDAFDVGDVIQSKTFDTMQRTCTIKKTSPAWLTFAPRSKAQLRDLGIGALDRDIALWFMLVCIFAACCGFVEHADVVHSWAVVVLWFLLHHLSFHTTSWRGSYLSTLLSPSAALLPLEWCIPLTDPELCADFESLDQWRQFISSRCGVDLDITA